MIIADGLSGAHFHRFSHLPGFRVFEEEGVWCTRLFPVFPTLSLPNRHTLLTGLLPRKHGIVGDFIYNWQTKQKFLNFTTESDFEQSNWWTTDPIYVTATKLKASVAMFFFPECKVNWTPAPPLCIPPRNDGLSFTDEKMTKIIVEATKIHDLILVYHSDIRQQLINIGPKNANTINATEVVKFQQSVGRLIAEAQERIDLNVMVVSTHGLIDVPTRNTSVGSGAVKQLIPLPGRTHQIYSQLRNYTPIPNVKIYYTTPKESDLPEWYHYKKSATVPDLVLIAQPGYAIFTRDIPKQIPEWQLHVDEAGMSGYNNHYPDVLGVFLAYGPVFRKGHHKGSLQLCDIYTLACAILRIDGCHTSCGRLLRIDDVLTIDARLSLRTNLPRTNPVTSLKITSLAITI
ncbi:type I phosphodiesterase / nucleotide pyrophosphatase, partial [Dictyocaulus viviparus]